MPRRPPADVDALTRQLRLLHGAFGGGVLIFALVVTGLVVAGVGPEPGAEPSTVPFGLLSLVHVAVAAGGWSVGLLVAGPVLLRRLPPSEDTARRLAAGLQRVQLHGVVRLAATEGPALLGLALCLLAQLDGTLGTQPWVALNALSALAFLAFAFVAWPSPEGLRQRLDGVLG